ncbi:MAG: hypothetical protein Q9194_007733, partial [Teloschistes cf. exilis]
IEARLNSPHGRLRNDDVHAHWKFATNLDYPEWSTTFESALGTAPDFHQIAPESQHSPPPTDDDDDDEPLPDLIDIITEPVTIRGKGRPKGSLKKRQQTFENSSQREPSGFERVDAAMEAQRGGGGRGRGGRQASQRGGAAG